MQSAAAIVEKASDVITQRLPPTQRYIRFVERFAQHFHSSPDRLSRQHIREYQAQLLVIGCFQFARTSAMLAVHPLARVIDTVDLSHFKTKRVANDKACSAHPPQMLIPLHDRVV